MGKRRVKFPIPELICSSIVAQLKKKLDLKILKCPTCLLFTKPFKESYITYRSSEKLKLGPGLNLNNGKFNTIQHKKDAEDLGKAQEE